MSVLRFLTAAACMLALAASALGQSIYLEEFPATAAAPLSSVGWANDITGGAAQENRIYAFGTPIISRVYAYTAIATSEAFYTSTTLDTGATGAAFPTIDPSAFQFGVSFFVDISPTFSPEDAESRFAVQMNGSDWYVSSAPLSVPQASGPFLNYGMPFDPAASNWLDLTVTGTGSLAAAGDPAQVTIGSAAAANLFGNITGAGLIVSHTGEGTHDFDNFQIAATARPGDVDLDTFVDLTDLEIIRTNFRQEVTSRILGDLTNDGFVDFDDYRIWKDNYPSVVPSADAVPEPAAASLALASLAIGVLARRWRR